MSKLILWLHHLFSRCAVGTDTVLSKASYTEIFLTKSRHKITSCRQIISIEIRKTLC